MISKLITRHFKVLVCLCGLLNFAMPHLQAATYYSSSLASNPNLTTNWWSNSNNTGSNPTNFTTAGDIFILQAGHTYATTAAWNILGTLQVAGTLTIGTANGIGNLTILNGGLVTGNAVTTLAAAGTFTIQDGGKYILNHGSANNTTTFNGTEAFSANSTFEYQNLVSPGTFVSGITYGNLIYNAPLTNSFPAAITINGNFEMKQGTLSFGTAKTIGGNFIQTGGTVTIEGSTVNGNFTVNGAGAVCRITQSASTSVTAQVIGNFDLTAGTFYINDGAQNIPGFSTSLDVNGNFTINGGDFYFPTNATTDLAGRIFAAKDVKFLSGTIQGFLSTTTLSAGIYFDGTAEQSFYSAFTLSSGNSRDAFYYKSPSGPTALNEYYIGSTGAQFTVNGVFGTPASGHISWPTSGTMIKDFVINNTTAAPNNTVTLRNDRLINDTLYRTNGRLLLGGVGIEISYASGATLEYNGTTAITTESTEFPTLNGPANLKINNPGSVTLHATRNISGKLIFEIDNGLLITGTCNATTTGVAIVLRDNATVQGAGNTRFVNGIVTKVGNDAFIFPIGTLEGTKYKYAPVQISAPTNVTDQYSTCYVGNNPGSALPSPGYDPNSLDPSLTGYNISTCEYWHANKSAGSSNVFLTLSWAYGRSCAFDDAADLVVANWTLVDGGLWANRFNNGSNSPGPSSPSQTFGWVTSQSTITNWGTFTLAHPTMATSTLQNQAITLKGRRYNNKDLLEWVLTRACLQAEIRIEISKDGIHFSPIHQFAVIDLESCQKTMQYVFEGSPSSRLYYRMKGIQPDGNILYSNTVRLQQSVPVTLQIFPNPATEQIYIAGQGQPIREIIVSNSLGQMIFTDRNISHLPHTLSVSGWSKGMYHIRVRFDNGATESYKILKQ